MSWALRELGLRADADERAVKRAYAVRLKTVRPDVDPEGFQALHEAYQAALAWVRDGARDEIDWDDETDAEDRDGNVAAIDVAALDRTTADGIDPVDRGVDRSADRNADHGAPPMRGASPAAGADALDSNVAEDDINTVAERRIAPLRERRRVEPVSVAAEERFEFDAEAFLRDCVRLAIDGDDGALERWLHAQPALWSLSRKTQIGHWLLQWLYEEQPPIPERRFDALADFFGFGDLQSGYDAHLLLRLRHRMQVTWELHNGRINHLAMRAGIDGGSRDANLRQTRRMLAQLSRPLRWPQAMLVGLMPRYPTALRSFLHQLDFGDIRRLPAPIDPAQAAFWDAAADRDRYAKPRLAIGASRCLIYSLLLTLAIAGRVWLRDGAVPAHMFTEFGPLVLAAVVSLWAGYLGLTWLWRWQSQPEDEDEPRPWLRRAAIPVAITAGCVLEYIVRLPLLPMLLVGVAAILAWSRYNARNGWPFAHIPGLGWLQRHGRKLWFAFIFLAIISPDGFVERYLLPLFAVAGLALWAADLRKQRALTAG